MPYECKNNGYWLSYSVNTNEVFRERMKKSTCGFKKKSYKFSLQVFLGIYFQLSKKL